MKRHGFTIWELLLVLVTIAVIAAILFPGFCSNPQKARQVSCASNMKQLGLGIMQYAQDNDEQMPDIAAAPGSKNTWRSAIFPYVKSTQLYQCPSRDDKGTAPDGFPRSYAANSAGIVYRGKNDRGNGAFAGPSSLPVNTDHIPYPISLIMFCEISRSNQPDFNIDNLAAFNPGSRTLWAGHLQEGYSNYLFADGHAKTLRPLATRAMWHRNASVPLSPSAVAILQSAQGRAGE